MIFIYILYIYIRPFIVHVQPCQFNECVACFLNERYVASRYEADLICLFTAMTNGTNEDGEHHADEDGEEANVFVCFDFYLQFFAIGTMKT